MGCRRGDGFPRPPLPEGTVDMNYSIKSIYGHRLKVVGFAVYDDDGAQLLATFLIEDWSDYARDAAAKLVKLLNTKREG